MKREAEPKPRYYTYSHFTLFVWELCEICSREFRRERGYRVHNITRNVEPSYVCSTCASTPVEAADKVHEQIKSNRPNAPGQLHELVDGVPDDYPPGS